jgi:Tripartite tricarboxylate transporter family receptor
VPAAGEHSENLLTSVLWVPPALRRSVRCQEVIMKLPRRQFMRLAAGVVALPSVSRVARADTYPAKPVRLMNGFAAGGTADIFARLIGQWLSERLGQQFLTENRACAASNIATEAVIRAPADGYTLLLATPANAITATLYEKLNYDFIRDTAPVRGRQAMAWRAPVLCRLASRDWPRAEPAWPVARLRPRPFRADARPSDGPADRRDDDGRDHVL